ncbi:MAG: glutathione S-transferase N-terminal domain-containing protein [Pseudomonadota bacterium]
MIEFHYAPTPNGWKVAIMLEECGLPYDLKAIRLAEGDQFKPEFLAISPNAKMPAILDPEPPEGFGVDPVPVFESGAILLYLAEKSGRFAPPPADRRARKALDEWLFWQAANQGPMGGQLSHFRNYAPEGDKPYGFKRYHGEYDRNLGVLDARLEGREWILDDYSIADMMIFPWAFIAKPLGASLDAFPNVSAWRERMKARPAVQAAINLLKDKQNRGQQNASNNKLLYNQSAAHLRGEA